MGKQVKTPRFYVDMVTFLHATGDTDWGISSVGGPQLLYMNCANPYTRPNSPDNNWLFRIGNFNNTAKTAFPINFCALLNHNFASDDNPFRIQGIHAVLDEPNDYDLLTGSLFNSQILNANQTSIELSPEFNGTSIWTLNEPLNKYWNFFGLEYRNGYDESVTHQLGSLVVGKYFDCPNSPDLNLTMSRRFDGIKRQKTVGGKTLANIYYDGPTEWTMNHPDYGTYKYPPFELDLPTTDSGTELGFNMRAKSGLGRKGLRSWKLTFSYISEDDMWMAYENSSISPFIANQTGIDATTNTDVPLDNGNSVASNPNPMLSDNSFNFVWNCTLGGTLPFIFQPDNTNNNPDQFSICNFRENSLSVQQVAFNTYKVSMTIDEIA